MTATLVATPAGVATMPTSGCFYTSFAEPYDEDGHLWAGRHRRTVHEGVTGLARKIERRLN